VNEERKTFLEAYIKLQAEIQNPEKNRQNPFFKSGYTDLAELEKIYRPILSKHNLAVIQTVESVDNEDFVDTFLFHMDGFSTRSRVRVKQKKDDMQGFGSGITYARRYGFLTALGISSADDDDDGNEASKKETKKSNGRKDIKDMTTGEINEELQRALDYLGFEGEKRNKFIQTAGGLADALKNARELARQKSREEG
jgi:hypothetical protein